MKTGPMILTGFQALNKLLGKAVYTSQDQLGGQQIMLPNGVTHLGVNDDYEGCEAIVRWLSYVPATANDLKPGMLAPADPVDRPGTARLTTSENSSTTPTARACSTRARLRRRW